MKLLSKLLPALGLSLSLFATACSSDMPQSNEVRGNENNTDEPVNAEPFVLCKGADISWLTQMEAQGIKFYYNDGTEGDCLEILKSLGMNAVRLRVWVNPSDGYNGTKDVIAKAQRATALGMDVMIDFHYSDSWADPGQQNVPASWAGQDLAQLTQTVTSYTADVCNQLKEAGVTPKWVQVGNETGNGLLWPYGKADTNPAGYAQLITAGYEGVKAVFADAKVIVHVHNGQDAGLFKWNFDILKNNGAKYDVIGMSLYPEPSNYAQYVSQAEQNMKACISNYDKDVMICEVGMGEAYVTECEAFLTECFKLSEKIEGNRMLGVLYWEPQCYNNWQGYKKGAFTSQGRPSAALNAYSYSSTGIRPVLAD